jgi:hypothetical protein
MLIVVYGKVKSIYRVASLLPLSLAAQVQQNVYAALLRMHYGVDCKRMFLVQLHPTLSTWAEHEVPDLREEVSRILEDRAAELRDGRSADT